MSRIEVIEGRAVIVPFDVAEKLDRLDESFAAAFSGASVNLPELADLDESLDVTFGGPVVKEG